MTECLLENASLTHAKRISAVVANQHYVFERKGNNLILERIYYSAQFDNCANCAVHLHTRHNHKSIVCFYDPCYYHNPKLFDFNS